MRCVEVDIRMTSDDHLGSSWGRLGSRLMSVVLHDAWIGRVTNIAEYSGRHGESCSSAF